MSPPPKKRISQAQIAQEIGCSQALVSMALNGHTKGISEKTYNAIRELATQQGYTPQGMKIDEKLETPRHRAIGYILGSSLNLATNTDYFSHIHQGLHEHLKKHELRTVYLGSADELNHPASSFASPFPSSLCGIAIMGEVEPTFLAKVGATNRPVVYLSDQANESCHTVLSNESEAGELLVKHLYDLGHRSFAWLGNDPLYKRKSAIEAALLKRGLQLDLSHNIVSKNTSRNVGYAAAESILQESKQPPTAWICQDGPIARGAITQLLKRQIGVGTTVSVAAFDTSPTCEAEYPTLTSAGAAPEAIGREVGRLLTQSAESEATVAQALILPATLTTGESTGPVQA